MLPSAKFTNPFKPGAGHAPPYLAGRRDETREFERLLGQETILDNLVLTGLRGAGKTVLLDTFKPIAQSARWFWVGNDVSEAATRDEAALALRILTDLSTVTSSIEIPVSAGAGIGFGSGERTTRRRLDFNTLSVVYERAPGLVGDKLKGVLSAVREVLQSLKEQPHGIVFAYDEAQNLADHAAKEQHPLSLLLDTFASLQKQGAPFLLVLTGLPTLFPSLVEARTFSERMFRVMFLKRLTPEESHDAIVRPISEKACPVRLSEESVQVVIRESGGYPYFIQFICREVYDHFLASQLAGQKPAAVPTETIRRKLDSDFFAGRWSRVTDRQRDLLFVIAKLENPDEEFTVQDVVETSARILDKPFSASHANQMLAALARTGLVYKNRHGRYSFAVPMFGPFVLRQMV